MPQLLSPGTIHSIGGFRTPDREGGRHSVQRGATYEAPSAIVSEPVFAPWGRSDISGDAYDVSRGRGAKAISGCAEVRWRTRAGDTSYHAPWSRL